jgi:alkanesulfonate monooxygenase SsuD/methylene tetrahydromethanopterin reductase-like flavin-dependent oxidoreductase (luciferase family)
VLVAALGPQALRVAGARTQGTSLAWVGPRTIREHIAPTLTAAAEAAGRESPRIVATLPVCVTDNAEGVRSLIATGLATYGQLPSYRAMFDREGVEGPGDVALVGGEDEVREAIETMARAGVTDFAPSEFATTGDERERTRALLKSAIDPGRGVVA